MSWERTGVCPACGNRTVSAAHCKVCGWKPDQGAAAQALIADAACAHELFGDDELENHSSKLADARAMRVDCSVCGAAAGKKCTDLRLGAEFVERSRPHALRIREGRKSE